MSRIGNHPERPTTPLIRRALRVHVAMLLIMVSLSAHALDPTLKLSQYVLDNWQIPQGLPQSSAQAVARTPDGYLWVGTQEGLARFDGVRFVVFDHANEPAIPDKHISVLYVDATGRLWVGTRAGIALTSTAISRPLRSCPRSLTPMFAPSRRGQAGPHLGGH